MAIELNHTIAWCSDQQRSAHFLTDILGLSEPRRFYHFLVVDLSNGVSIDYFETTDHIAIQHFAFLVSEKEFDEIYRDYVAEPFPVRTLVQSNFAGFDIEVDAVLARR